MMDKKELTDQHGRSPVEMAEKRNAKPNGTATVVQTENP